MSRVVNDSSIPLTKRSVLFLASIRKRSFVKDNYMRFDRFPSAMLCFVAAGSGTVLIGNERREFEPYHLFYVDRDTPVELSLSSGKLEVYTMALQQYTEHAGAVQANTMHMRSEPPALFIPGYIRTRKTKQIWNRVQLLYEASRNSSDAMRLHLQFQELLYLIVQECSDRPRQNTAKQGLNQVTEYMQSHFHDKIDMKTLSAMANLTPSSFSRLFKRTLGESPMEYLTRVRMDSAKTLLSQKGSRVRDVSAAVGYEDEFHFSRIFHRTVGVSPTFYMKRNQLKVAVASCLQLQNSLLSLGVEPVASVNCCKNPGMGDLEYEHFFTKQWEELVRAAPDVLIGDAYHMHLYDKFSEIAPSVVLASDDSWIVNYRKMADILGRKQEAEQTIHRLALRATEAKGLLHRRLENKTVCVIQVSHDGISIQGAIDHPLNELLYRDLGLRPGRSVPLHAKMLELPPEWLPPIDADYLFILKKHQRAGSDDVYERLCGVPAWKLIHAVRTGNVKAVPHWLRMSWTPIGRNIIINELLELTGIPLEEAGYGT